MMNNTELEEKMFTRMFEGPVGKASLASIAAMAAFIALSTQMHATPVVASSHYISTVELA